MTVKHLNKSYGVLKHLCAKTKVQTAKLNRQSGTVTSVLTLSFYLFSIA